MKNKFLKLLSISMIAATPFVGCEFITGGSDSGDDGTTTALLALAATSSSTSLGSITAVCEFNSGSYSLCSESTYSSSYTTQAEMDSICTSSGGTVHSSCQASSVVYGGYCNYNLNDATYGDYNYSYYYSQTYIDANVPSLYPTVNDFGAAFCSNTSGHTWTTL